MHQVTRCVPTPPRVLEEATGADEAAKPQAAEVAAEGAGEGAGEVAGEGAEGAAYASCPRCPKDLTVPWRYNSCEHTAPSAFAYMGYSLRVARWRYGEWRRWNGTRLAADWAGPPEAVELYGHAEDDEATDFDLTENANLARRPELAGVAARLAALLRARFAPRPSGARSS